MINKRCCPESRQRLLTAQYRLVLLLAYYIVQYMLFINILLCMNVTDTRTTDFHLFKLYIPVCPSILSNLSTFFLWSLRNQKVFIICIIENQSFSTSYDLAPSPLSRQQVDFFSQSSCVSPVELTDGRGRRGKGPNHRVYRVPECLSFRRNWVPHPLTHKRVLLPP